MKKVQRKEVGRECSNILLYVFLGIGLFAFVADHLGAVKVQAIEDVAEVAQSLITLLASIWITCYLLFMELFKDRFSLEPLKKEQLPRMKNIFILVIYDVLYGCVLTFFDYGFWGCVFFVAVSLLTVMVIFVNVFIAYKTLMVSSYVDKFFERVTSALNTHTGIVEQASLNEVKYILDESIAKEEYYTSQNIVRKTGQTFREYLGNLIKISEQSGVSNAEESFKTVVDFNIKQLELCKNIPSDLLVNTLLIEQKNNIFYCVEHKQYEWFKFYLHKYCILTIKMEKEENVYMSEKLYGLFFRLIEKLIKDNKKEWIKYAIDEIESLTLTYIYVYNKTNIRNYVMLLVDILELCIDEDKEELYDIFFEKIEKFTKAKHIEHGMFKEVKMLYASLFAKLLNKDIRKALDFTEVILRKNVSSYEDTALLEFKLYAILELSCKNTEDEMYQDRLFKHHIDALVDAIGLDKDYNGYVVLPDFYQRIEKQDCSKERMDDTISSLKRLLHNCIVKDYLPPFYTLLTEIRESLAKTTKSQKELQKNILGIYFWLFSKTIVLENQQFFELSFDFFQQSVEAMDKNKSISSDLGKYIIKSVSNGYSGMKRDNEKLTVWSIELLFSFLAEGEEYQFVQSSFEQKKFLCRTLFNIGTDCIENNFEEGLRKVSNAVGWLIIYSLKQTTYGLTTYLIGRANELYYLAKKMDVSSKTQMFMLTLFTTVGTFCCKEAAYMQYRDAIIKCIQDESIERVKIAVSLRTSENDMWNELYENKIEHLTNEFVKQFERSHKKNKG